MTRLELLRRGHGLTVRELSEKSGVSAPTIIKLEAGRSGSISAKALVALAGAIGCEVEDFFNNGKSEE